MINDALDVLESALDSISTDLTSTKVQGAITYPFMFIDSISEVEMKYLQKQLPKGDMPLMIKVDNRYALVKHTTMSLCTIKHLSRFKDREIWVKESKELQHPVEKFIDMLLLEEE